MYLIAAQTCVLVDTWTSLSGRIRHISDVGISIQACLTGRTPATRRWLAQWVERASSVQRFGPRCSSRVRVRTWGLLHVTPISLILFVVILSAVLSIKPYKGKKKPCQMRTNWRRLLGRQTSRWPHLTCRHIHLNRTGGSGDGSNNDYESDWSGPKQYRGSILWFKKYEVTSPYGPTITENYISLLLLIKFPSFGLKTDKCWRYSSQEIHENTHEISLCSCSHSCL